MRSHRQWRQVTRIVLLAGVATLVLFYVYPFEQGPKTQKFLPTAFRTVTTTITQYSPITGVLTTSPAPPKTRLEKHTYRPDGLLEVNYNGPHPIFELIRRAEKEWEEKLNKASKSLVEAVKEYQRRYKRDPPKGFDLWWEYAVEHNVQLPDEYDQIFHDLEPFWGVEPSDLFEIQAELEKKVDSYTIGKENTTGVRVLTYAFTEGRYDQLIHGSKRILTLLNDIEHLLPDFRMTLSPHDGPNRLSDHGVKQATLEAAASKTFVERGVLPKAASLGWISACPPSSLARRIPINLDIPPALPTRKTFIYDHKKTMDPCAHPDHFHHHGQFLSHNNGPSPQPIMVPEFGNCATTLHHNILIPNPYAWVADVTPRNQDPIFDAKSDERLMWRGRNTGMFHASTTRWKNAHRDFLVRHTNKLDGMLNILMPPNRADERVGAPKKLRESKINPAFFDITFVDKPIACSATVCPQLEGLYPFRPYMRQDQAGAYRYIIDVDGNGWSGRFKRLMTSNALIFKSTIYPEWYSDRIQPWLHFVPIQVDLSDLHDTLIFFRGDGNGEGSHEDLGRKIATAGRDWSLKFWRQEDLNAYFFRLILEYARIMSSDRASMSFSPKL